MLTGRLVAGRFRVGDQLGKGGMGEVYAAIELDTQKPVALKVLRAEVQSKRNSVKRLKREAQAGGVIKSPFVTEVLDIEEDPSCGLVLVFELLEGESLIQRLKRTGPISLDELWGIVECVWLGLADAHAAGIIHRDLKPSNVFLTPRGDDQHPQVKILDFGISKLPREFIQETLTRVGQSLGTFSFMPPEQIGKAKEVDERADIYSAATLIFQSLSGQLPYNARSAIQIMDLKARQEPRRLSDVMRYPVPPEVDDFVAKGLAREPENRFQSAHEALEAWRALRPADAASILDEDDSTGSGAAADPAMHNDAQLPRTQIYQRGALPGIGQALLHAAPNNDFSNPPVEHPTALAPPSHQDPTRLMQNPGVNPATPNTSSPSAMPLVRQAAIYVLGGLLLVALGFGLVTVIMRLMK